MNKNSNNMEKIPDTILKMYNIGLTIELIEKKTKFPQSVIEFYIERAIRKGKVSPEIEDRYKEEKYNIRKRPEKQSDERTNLDDDEPMR